MDIMGNETPDIREIFEKKLSIWTNPSKKTENSFIFDDADFTVFERTRENQKCPFQKQLFWCLVWIYCFDNLVSIVIYDIY